jgi:hypothetical protein
MLSALARLVNTYLVARFASSDDADNIQSVLTAISLYQQSLTTGHWPLTTLFAKIRHAIFISEGETG